MRARLQDWFYRNIWAPETRAGGTFNLENPRIPINGWTVDQILGNPVSKSGQAIGYDSALTLSAVWRSMQIRAGIVSSLPFQQYEKTTKGRRLISVDEHNLAYLISARPNDYTTKAVYFERAMNHYDGWGNHYALIHRNGIGRVVALELLHPRTVSVYKDTAGRVAYKIKGMDAPISSDRIIHVPNMGDDIVGKSVLTYAREDLGFQMDARDYGGGFYARGGVPIGLFYPQGPATNQQRAELINSWETEKSKQTDIAVPFGWKYERLSMSPQDAAMINTIQVGIDTVARWFGIPPQKLANMDSATYNNVEHMGISFLQDTMTPILRKLEIEYTTKLLPLPSERNMYLEFNIDAYLRADSIAKSESLAKMVQFGLRTPNEARELDNYDSKEGGDDLFMQSGTMPIPLLKQMVLTKAAPAQRKFGNPDTNGMTDEEKDDLREQLKAHVNGNGKH